MRLANRILVLYIGFILPCSGVLLSQEYAPKRFDTISEIEADMNKAGGELYVCDFPDKISAKPPKGYKPFYISLFGRHGARYVHETRLYSELRKLFVQADKDGRLTKEGERLHKLYGDFYKQVAHREGELTFAGQEQWKKIASKMFEDYPEVFRKDTYAEAFSTNYPRVLMSMFSFLDRLRSLDKTFDFKADAGSIYLDFLQPNNAAAPSSIKAKPWPEEAVASQKAFLASKIDASAFASRFFNDLDYLEKAYGHWNFESSLALAVLDIQCLDGVVNIFKDVFTKEEILSFWEIRNYNGYLYLGASPLTDNKIVKASSASLKEIIESSDKDIEEGRNDLRLRFSHDSALLPLLAFMRLNNFGAVVDKAEEVKYYWRSFDIPMASNLQLIFYRNKKKAETLVLPLYNGQTVSLPFKSFEGPFYSWNEFKKYYMPLIKEAEAFLEAYKANNNPSGAERGFL